MDAYRLDSIAQFEQIGFDDYCHPGSIVLIEWADKVEQALTGTNYIKIELSHLVRLPEKSASQISLRM